MPLPRPPAAVVFDMDGLIFDTEALYQEAFLAVTAQLGLAASAGVFLNMVGRPWTANRMFLLDHFGAEFAVDSFATAWREAFRHGPDPTGAEGGGVDIAGPA
jgi:beta-phosphoglucomutase-like phosphatase (HAD superfamily)